MPATPRARPSAPPIAASTRLSVSSWRTIRSRPAPTAVRSAISRLRPSARTSCRLATLAHAISRTRPNRPEQHEEQTAGVADQLLADRLGAEDRAVRKHLGEAFSIELGRALQHRPSLCEGDVGSQPPGDDEVVPLIRLRSGRAGTASRRPGPHRSPRKSKAVAHNADDHVQIAAQRETATDDLRVAVEAPFPDALADERYPRSVGKVLVRREGASVHDRRAEEPEVGGGYLRPAELLGSLPAGVVDAAGAKGRDIVEHLGLRAPPGELRRRPALVPALRCHYLEPDDPVRIGERRRLQQHGVDDGERRRSSRRCRGPARLWPPA